MSPGGKPGKEACRILKEIGFEVVGVRQNGHLRITTKPHYVFIAPVSPGDKRSAVNFRAFARRIWRQLHEHPP